MESLLTSREPVHVLFEVFLFSDMSALPWLADTFVSEAIDPVIVDDADCLHEGVTDRGADKLEATTQEIAAQGV